MHHYNEPGGMRYGHMTYGMMGYSWIWIVAVIVLIILVLIGIFLLIKQSQRPLNSEQKMSREDRSLAILKERFAKGEISEEQYYEKRNVLQDDKR